MPLYSLTCFDKFFGFPLLLLNVIFYNKDLLLDYGYFFDIFLNSIYCIEQRDDIMRYRLELLHSSNEHVQFLIDCHIF